VQVIKTIRRRWKRFVVAGVDFVYDYEIASLRGLSGALSASDRMKLQEQQ